MASAAPTPPRLNKEVPLGYLATNGVSLHLSDTLAHAVELLQVSASGAVPVMENGYLRGLVSDREIARGLATMPDAPVEDFMTSDVPIAPAGMPAGEGLKLLSEMEFPALPVAMPDGRFLGTVGRTELLTAMFHRRRPMSVGGMATPLGVYLSDGVHRGGAGDFGLMLTGIFLAFGQVVSTVLATIAAHGLWHTGLWKIVPPSYFEPAVFILCYALWFRLSPIAGYHAAEHQTVHAIERNEPLTVERVGRMPRPHPRCGTNIVVLAAMFMTLYGPMKVDPLAAGIFSLIVYRFFGHWVQLHVTTRPASRMQLESGIRAGEQVLERYQQGAFPGRQSGWKRLWNMGLVQVAMGNFLCLGTVTVVAHYVPFVQRWVGFLQ